ncbi:MAG: RNA pseudouridine synthase, partial [Actinobacteria bacterium]|nr:RNA pseudouridine synthase [Actinomycetota bacterium]
ARELAFDHPRTGERVSFQAAAPADFAAVVATLR